MHSPLFALASLLALSLTPPCGAGRNHPLPRAQGVGQSLMPAGEVRLTGELRFYRHIDTVTGRGAASLVAGGNEIPLDFRRFDLDILLRPGPHVIEGHWSEEGRLVVTGAHPTAGRAALR